jgi:hypothetical protein
MKKFEYFTSFFPFGVNEHTDWFSSSDPLMTYAVNVKAILPHPELGNQMDELGAKGWELVSVQPLWKTEMAGYNEREERPFSRFVGYYFFWKREL